MKNYPYRINVDEAIAVVDDWLQQDRDVYWGMSPEEFKTELMNAAVDGSISLSDAHRIVELAKTSKMHGLANKGFGYFKEEWKKMRY